MFLNDEYRRYEMDENKTLLFVYNADSGLFNELKDYGKKIVDKESYQCNLCGVTFGLTGMKKEWKQYLSKLNYQTQFIHRDEFHDRYDRNDRLPAVFLKKNDNLSLLISKEEIDSCDSVDELKKLVNNKIS